jgi:hypothetical protein
MTAIWLLICVLTATPLTAAGQTQPASQPVSASASSAMAAAAPATQPAPDAPAPTAEPAPTPAQAAQAPAAARAGSSIRDNRRQLWRAHLTAPTDDRCSAGLQEAIQRIQAMQLSRRTGPAQAEAELARAVPATGPAQPAVTTVVPAAMDPRVLAQLREIPRQSVADPAALADTLYITGQQELAGVFYQLALEDAAQPPATQAWLMFQLANCRRQGDPPAATGLYEKVMAQHGDSPWAPLAQFELNLLRWQQDNQVHQFLQALSAELPAGPMVLGAATPPGKAR